MRMRLARRLSAGALSISLLSMSLLLSLILGGLSRPASAQDQPGLDADAESDDSAQMDAARAAGNAYYARIAPELAASGQPRDLALAALLLRIATAGSAPPADFRGDDGTPSQPADSDPRVTAWRQQATARAGSDAITNVLLVSARDDAALRAQAAARWQQAEPDNLAPLLFGRATGDALVAATRTSTRLNLHFYELTRWMQSALLAHPPLDAERDDLTEGDDVPAAEFAAITASTLASAAVLPDFKPLVDACRATTGTAAARITDCGHVADLMRTTSDTMAGTMAGFAIAQRLPAAPDAGATLTEQRRALDWRMQQWGQVASRQPREGMPEYARLLSDPTIVGEQQLMERVLTQAGVPLQPPAAWTPPRRGN